MKERKIKKLISACLAFSMLASAAPCVLAEGTENAQTKKQFVENFESYEIGAKPTYMVYDSSMNKSQIVDDGTGNKVLMVKYDRKQPHALGLNLGNTYSDGAYKYSFKAKIVNGKEQDWYSPFMTLQSDDNKAIFESKIAQYGWQLHNTSWDSFDVMKKFVDSKGYYNINRIIDLDGGKHYIQKDLAGNYVEESLANKKFSKIYITGMIGTNGFIAAQAVTNDETNKDYGIIYIDDIEIVPVEAPKMVSKTAPVGGEVIKTNKVFKATYDSEIGDVTAENIAVTKDNAAMDSGFTVSKSDKTVSVTFDNELETNAQYKIVAKNVPSRYSATVKSGENTIADFKAVEVGDEFAADFESYNVGDVPYFVSINGSAMGAEVAADEKGNKVLKVTYSEKVSGSYVKLDLGKIFLTGVYDYDYDFRIVNHAIGGMSPFMTPYNGDTNLTTRQLIDGGIVYDSGYVIKWNSASKNTNGYYDTHSVIDFGRKKIMVPAASGMAERSFTSGATAMSHLRLQGYPNLNVPGDCNENSPYYSTTVDTYFIDNISIKPVAAMTIAGRNTPIGGEVVKTNREYKAFLDNDVSSVSKDNVVVTKDGSVITEGFEVTGQGKTLTVGFTDDMTVGSKYVITAKNVKSLYAPELAEAKIAEFTAVEVKDEFIESFEGYEVGDVPYFIKKSGTAVDAYVDSDVEGNKALRVTYKGDSGYVDIDLGKTYDAGVYNNNADVKIANAGYGCLAQFLTPYHQDKYTAKKQILKSGIAFGSGKIVDWNDYGGLELDKYYSINTMIDFNNQKNYFYQGANLTEAPFDNDNSPGTAMSRLRLGGLNDSSENIGKAAAEKSPYYSTTTDTYFIDNISLTPQKVMYCDNEAVSKLSEAASKTVNVKLNKKDIKESVFTVIFALYNGDKLLSVKAVNSEDIVGNYATAEISVPENTENLTLSYMVIDSFGSMKPIGKKTDF